MAETHTDSEASGSGEGPDPNNFFRKNYGTGRDEVEQTTQLATERAYCVAGLSGSEDGVLQIMLAEVEYMLDTPELRHSPLCCSFLLRCAEEFEATGRPRLALARYKQAQELASKDSDMKDMLRCASSRIANVMAGGTTSDSGSRTWDSLPRRFIRGPYYVDFRRLSTRNYRHYGWVYEISDGRSNVEEITFSLCDFAQKQAGGDEDEYMQGMMKHVEEMEREPRCRGSPVHCSVILHCARQFKKMGQLEVAVELFRQALEFATNNPQGMNQVVGKQSCDDLAMIFSGELQPEDRWRFLELVDVPALWRIGSTCFDSGKFEEAINCYTDCLLMDSSFASRYLYALASSYEACQEHNAALILVEQARLGSEVENCRCNWPQIDHSLDAGIVMCPRHHVLPWTLLEQGRLQCRYGYEEEAKTTLEKGLQLAKEFGNKDLVRLIEKEILTIMIRQHNDSTFMSGNFSFSSADLKRTIESSFQKFMDEQLEFSRTDPLKYYSDYNLYEYFSERSQHLLELSKAGPYYNDDMVHRKLEHDMKEVARYETCDDDDHVSKGFGLCNAHLDVAQDLKDLKRSGQEVKHHFKEAVEAAKAWSDREDMDALDMRLRLVSFALDIQEFGEAEALSKGVIHVVEKKLNQFVSMSHEHALRFLEITKHAYTSLTRTYLWLAHEIRFQNGSQRLAEPRLQEYMQKSLLCTERLKGRLLMKLLDLPVTSTSGDAIRLPSYDDKHSSTCEATLSDTKFHGDDDWALNYLFHPSDELFHHGSKMLFVSYTMLSPELLHISFVNSVDGSIVGFGHRLLNKFIDKETRKLAEDELDILKTGLHNYENSNESTTPNRKNEVSVSCIPRIPSSLYAMNKPGSRMRYFNPWIPGLVARIQRLAYEAQHKRASREARSSVKDEIDQIVNEIDSLLRKLYEILIGPEIGFGLREAMKMLGADYTLVFVPHEDLSVVPFQALRDEHGKYLIEQYPVAVSPSMWMARQCQHLYHEQLKSPPGPKLLVGRKAGYPAGIENLELAHTEIAKIKENCGQNCLEVLDDSSDAAERPMKERVMQHAQTASWAHFAVHGEISPSFPHGSLLLGDTASTRWSSDEITASGLPCARSVVLSACQSGLGTLGGEGVLGFARAFLRAGVPSCVVSMWQVNESFCLGFMDQLYTYLHGGEDLAHAMQKSILNLMKEERKKLRKRDAPIPRWSVLDWASFSCIGYAGVKFPGTLDSPNDRAEPEHTNPNTCRVKHISIGDDQITIREDPEENIISVSQPSTSASPNGKDVVNGVHVDDSFSKVRENDRNAVKETSGLWKLDELLTLVKECLDRGRSGDALQESREILENYMSLICKHRRQLDSRPDLHTAIGDFASWFLYVLFHLEDFEACIRWFAIGISRQDALKDSLEGSGSVLYNVAVSFLKRSVVNPDPQTRRFNEDFIEKGREFLKKSCRLQVECLDSLVFQPALITVGFREHTGMFAHLGRVEVVPVEMFEKLLGTPYSHFKEQQVMHLLDEVLGNVIGMKDSGFHVEAEAVRRMGVTFGSKIEEEELRNLFLVSLSDIAL